MSDATVEAATQAISDVFGDTSVDQETTIDRLRDLARECQECITIIEDDIDKEARRADGEE
jgi:hypothetical protein